MLENIIVGAIILGAIAYIIFHNRKKKKKSCSSGGCPKCKS